MFFILNLKVKDKSWHSTLTSEKKVNNWQKPFW